MAMAAASHPSSHTSSITQTDMANAIRFLSADAVQAANSGHPGMPMGMADVATVLFSEFLNFDPKHPNWPDRDRFILSAGHGSMLLYSLLYLTGYDDITLDELKKFRQLHARTAGHPEFGEAGGIETTTGPLGQGITNAVGFAMAERMLNAEFGDDLTSHYTYTIAGDGCLMEGISQEAIAMAGHMKLNKLIVLWDDNNISIDGEISLSDSTDQLARFAASGWNTIAVDGHNHAEISKAIQAAKNSDKPTLIACKTTIGYGSPNKAGTSATHGSPLGTDELAATREKLGWSHAPFEIPHDILHEWRSVSSRGQRAYNDWSNRLKASPKADNFTQRMSGEMGAALAGTINDFKQKASNEAPSEATRKSSGRVLSALVPVLPELVGGSADLTGSNLTKTGEMEAFSADNYAGRYVYWGIREHGMASAMNGIALHGGFVPYAGTFLVFTDYCRPAIRLSALMKQRVIYVMTHDSIGLGEDGPTHQPVEHLSSLRAIPNLNVFRPADSVETAECWAISLATQETPSILALSRQNLPTLRTEHTPQNLCATGGYALREAEGGKQATVTLIATGSEVEIAVNAQAKLAEQGIAAKVVSMPCLDLFYQQPAAYRAQVLGTGKRIVIEAGIRQSWDRLLGDDDAFIGMNSFGASAPAEDLYDYFGITIEAVVSAAKA